MFGMCIFEPFHFEWTPHGIVELTKFALVVWVTGCVFDLLYTGMRSSLVPKPIFGELVILETGRSGAG